MCKKCGCFVEERYRLLCTHFFCLTCIRDHINEYDQNIKCPNEKCSETIKLIDLINILSQEDIRRLFQKQKKPFLHLHRDKFKECPTPKCGNILFKHKKLDSLYEHVLKYTGKSSEPAPAELPEGENLKYEILSKLQEQMNKNLPDESQKGKRYLVFCECCGNDYCFNCEKNHDVEDCPDAGEGFLDSNPFTDSSERQQIGRARGQCSVCNTMYEKQLNITFHRCLRCSVHICTKCDKSFKLENALFEHQIVDHQAKIVLEQAEEDLGQDSAFQ